MLFDVDKNCPLHGHSSTKKVGKNELIGGYDKSKTVWLAFWTKWPITSYNPKLSIDSPISMPDYYDHFSSTRQLLYLINPAVLFQILFFFFFLLMKPWLITDFGSGVVGITEITPLTYHPAITHGQKAEFRIISLHFIPFSSGHLREC